jgi:hypothetical protein
MCCRAVGATTHLRHATVWELKYDDQTNTELAGELVLGFRSDIVDGITQRFLVWKPSGWDMYQNKTKTGFVCRSKNDGSQTHSQTQPPRRHQSTSPNSNARCSNRCKFACDKEIRGTTHWSDVTVVSMCTTKLMSWWQLESPRCLKRCRRRAHTRTHTSPQPNLRPKSQTTTNHHQPFAQSTTHASARHRTASNHNGQSRSAAVGPTQGPNNPQKAASLAPTAATRKTSKSSTHKPPPSTRPPPTLQLAAQSRPNPPRTTALRPWDQRSTQSTHQNCPNAPAAAAKLTKEVGKAQPTSLHHPQYPATTTNASARRPTPSQPTKTHGSAAAGPTQRPISPQNGPQCTGGSDQSDRRRQMVNRYRPHHPFAPTPTCCQSFPPNTLAVPNVGRQDQCSARSSPKPTSCAPARVRNS